MTAELPLRAIQGDALEVLRGLPEESVQCCVTSPPYWGLRDYGVKGQIGLEDTVEEYVAKMVAVFREVRRVLRSDGTCWVNLGDSYAGSWGAQSRGSFTPGTMRDVTEKYSLSARQIKAHPKGSHTGSLKNTPGLKPKDLIGIPWRVAFALQADGWYLRSDIIWHKPNPMPESVRDRPTKAHEYMFLLTKSERYFYDMEATLEACSESTHERLAQDVVNQIGSARANGGARAERPMKAVQRKPNGWHNSDSYHGENPVRLARKSWKGSEFHDGKNAQVHPNVGKNRVKDNLSMDAALAVMPSLRNKRTVWTVGTYGFAGAHFATFPPKLIEPCVLAGSRAGDVVLDPFAGSGTTGEVALSLGRKALLIELNGEYLELIQQRTGAVTLGLGL